MRTHWSKLPAVRYGFTRVPDEVGTGRRLVQCDACKQIIPSLGVGYHLGNESARPCTERTPRTDQPVPAWPRTQTVGPEYGPPTPPWHVMHAALPTEACDAATTPAGCYLHPAPVIPRAFHWAG